MKKKHTQKTKPTSKQANKVSGASMVGVENNATMPAVQLAPKAIACVICGAPTRIRCNANLGRAATCRKPACIKARRTALQKARRWDQTHGSFFDSLAVKFGRKPRKKNVLKAERWHRRDK